MRVACSALSRHTRRRTCINLKSIVRYFRGDGPHELSSAGGGILGIFFVLGTENGRNGEGQTRLAKGMRDTTREGNERRSSCRLFVTVANITVRTVALAVVLKQGVSITGESACTGTATSFA